MVMTSDTVIIPSEADERMWRCDTRVQGVQKRVTQLYKIVLCSCTTTCPGVQLRGQLHNYVLFNYVVSCSTAWSTVQQRGQLYNYVVSCTTPTYTRDALHAKKDQSVCTRVHSLTPGVHTTCSL